MLTFKSKAEARRFFSGMLSRYGDGARVCGDDHDRLMELLQRHPEAGIKIGTGVECFTVERHVGYGSRGFWATRTDGSRTDWSYLACLAPPSREAQAKAAMRSAVRDQIEAFRSTVQLGASAVCPITGEALTSGNLHIDHEIPFDRLASDFLYEFSLGFADVVVNATEDGSVETRMTNDALRDAWAEYHRRNAKLRGVSRTANLSTLRRNPKGGNR